MAPRTTVKPADVLAVADDVTTNVLIERQGEMRVIVLGALAGKNVHQLGPPGTGKSLGLREFCARIAGARYFEKAVHAQMPADALVGGYDMAQFAKTGEFARNVTNYLPNAHVGNIDEITRANGPTLDALLPMLNTEERAAEHNGGMMQTPILFLVTASNFMPDPADPRLGALVDRFTLMQYVEYVKSDESFKTMLDRRHARRLAERDEKVKRVTISLEQFMAAQDAVARVKLSTEFTEAYADVRSKAKGKGLMISDRRWMELSDVARASAWLAGRDELMSGDLGAIENGLWRERDELKAARELVEDYIGALEKEAGKRKKESEKIIAEFERLRPIVEGCPPGTDPPEGMMTDAMDLGRKLKPMRKRVAKLLADADKAQEDVPTARELKSELDAIADWFPKNDLLMEV